MYLTVENGKQFIVGEEVGVSRKPRFDRRKVTIKKIGVYTYICTKRYGSRRGGTRLLVGNDIWSVVSGAQAQ